MCRLYHRRKFVLAALVVAACVTPLRAGEAIRIQGVHATQGSAGGAVKKQRPARRRRDKKLKRGQRNKMNEQAQKSQGGGGPLPNETWGGEYISLMVTSGGARLEFNCAHAIITQRIELDAGGKFDVAGEYVIERGGPQRAGEKPDAHPARFLGEVRGGTMTLTVKLTDTGTVMPAVNLIRGEEPRIIKCL